MIRHNNDDEFLQALLADLLAGDNILVVAWSYIEASQIERQLAKLCEDFERLPGKLEFVALHDAKACFGHRNKKLFVQPRIWDERLSSLEQDILHMLLINNP